MKLKIISVVFIVLFTACQKQQVKKENQECQTIDVKIDAPICENKLSDISENKLVYLPTSDSILIGEIKGIYQQNGYIYLSDPFALYKFDKEGNFHGKINRQGDGPEEYHNISDFQIDDEGNAWIFSRNTKSIYRYSWNNELLQRIELSLWMERIRWNGDGFYIYSGNETGFNNTCQLHYLNLKTQQIEHHFKSIDEHKSKYLFVHMANVFQRAKDNTVYFNQLFNDTVYTLTPTSYNPEFVVNLGGRNIPQSFYDQNYTNIMEFFMKLHQEDRYAYGVDAFIETDKAYWIGYFYQKQYNLSIIPKDTKKEQLRYNTLYVDKLFNYPINLSDVTLHVQDCGQIIIPLQSFDVMEYGKEHLSPAQLEELKNKIHYTEDQNPILLIIDLA